MSDALKMAPTMDAPTRAELQELAERRRFAVSDGELDTIATLTAQLVTAAEAAVGHLPPPEPPLGRRDPGRPAMPEDDPWNAIVRWCDVALEGASGVLDSLRVAFKDCIAVAGVPLTAGSTLLDGFIPREDSTVARRVIEAGGRIVAMTNMDCMAWSGYGDTSVHGATRNPVDPTRTAGGSSGGSAAALFYDGVDAAFGCDQGGSVRKPAAYVGAIGLKPTYGLIPYTRILGIDQAVDHIGPMGRTAEVVARLLDAVSGRDGEDPRQADVVPAVHALHAVTEAPDDLSGLRVSVVAEGLDRDAVGVTDEVIQAFWDAIDRFRALGARVEEVSIPAHLIGGDITLTGCAEGALALFEGGLNGYQWRGGRYWPEVAEVVARNIADRARDLSINTKVALLVGEALRKRHGGAVYGAGHNLHAELRRQYSAAFADADVLALPTTPGLAHTLENDLTPAERIMRGWADGANTAPTNVSGHPAISLPAAQVGGQPVGVMLVAPHFADDRLLSIARTYEATTGWLPVSTTPPR
jgi:amidase